MQVYRELFIRGAPDRLAATIDCIRQSLADGWAQDVDAEKHMRSAPPGNREMVACFSCSEQGHRRAATLFLLQKEAESLYVPNVVPARQHQLSHAEYNAILAEFFMRFAEPCAVKSGVRAELTESQADLERWLSPETAERLRLFSDHANKRTGSSHPSDRELWYAFIVSAHAEAADLSGSTLARWLGEVGGWDDERAHALAIEYEFARGLLAFANGERVGAQ